MDLERVARGAAQDAGGLDVALLGDFLPTVVRAAGSGRPLRRTQLDRYAGHGAEAARRGVPLRALIDLYLSASWRLWTELPVVQSGTAEQVRAAGLAVLRAADDGVAALAEGFQLARADLVRRQEVERHEVFEALLAGGPAATAVLDAAAGLGLDLTGPHAVLVARELGGIGTEIGTGTEPATTPAAVLGRLERALSGRLGDAHPLVSLRQGRLVAVVAAPDADAVVDVVERAETLLRTVPGRWQLVLGRPVAGPGGVRVSYDQADETLELAARLGLSVPVVTPAQVAVHRVLLRDRVAMADYVETVLGPLAQLRGGPGPLLETLDAFFAAGAVVTETARRLHLSVRAVSYRLARVAQVLGRDPADPEERLALHVAVVGARALGWPAES